MRKKVTKGTREQKKDIEEKGEKRREKKENTGQQKKRMPESERENFLLIQVNTSQIYQASFDKTNPSRH